MSLDAYGVKLKDDDNWILATWDDLIEDFDESSIIPNTNIFSNKTYKNIHQHFVNQISNDIEFTGDPCCSRNDMIRISKKLDSWLKENPNSGWEYQEYPGANIEKLSPLEVHDLIEYIQILNKHGCVMWFSW